METAEYTGETQQPRRWELRSRRAGSGGPRPNAFVARQPILDAGEKRYGYELLFRSGKRNTADHANADWASINAIHQALHVAGLNEMIGRTKIFVNVTGYTLLEGIHEVLPPKQTVLELPSAPGEAPELLERIDALRKDGYRVAISHKTFEGGGAIQSRADFAKVDFCRTDEHARRILAEQLRDAGIRPVAERVEQREEFEWGQAMGFELFQGYFFCQPQIVAGLETPMLKSSQFRLLTQVSAAHPDFQAVAETISRDVTLAGDLLRYLRSAAFGLSQPVSTIQQALALLGEKQLKRWACLVAMAGLTQGKPAELARTALIRAALCERLAGPLEMEDRHYELFLLGLLSVVDAMVGRSMTEVIGHLPLAPDLRGALLGDSSPMGKVLALVRGYEKAEWTALTALTGMLKLDSNALANEYQASIQWADQTLQR